MSSRHRLGFLVAIGGLLVALLLLVTSARGRVLYYTARMRSHDPDTALHARTALRQIGRPWIDGVYPELVARDISDAIGPDPRGCVFFGDLGPIMGTQTVLTTFRIHDVISDSAQVTSAGQSIMISGDRSLLPAESSRRQRVLIAALPDQTEIVQVRLHFGHRVASYEVRDMESLDPQDEAAVLSAVRAQLSKR